ncbi:hypothetical protein M9H77_07037 [Catharanthus roseus]|uniref:Uncharacterized protein n=2 Tax=Catharanthus roseus TaxID=4058 RepID=A0ACC0BTS5_CATRO|nr:hypothetical protein M9H77_07036 [Catharanthus roseus]KAI5676087.1 hypothetical protein M9H77_07037 [Catharanthus roseus]
MIGEGRLKENVKIQIGVGTTGPLCREHPCQRAYQRTYELTNTLPTLRGNQISNGSWAHGPPKGSVEESCEEEWQEQWVEQSWVNVLLLWKAIEYCVEVSVVVE